MSEEIGSLIGFLLAYNPGDLLGAIGIIEMCENLLNQSKLDKRQANSLSGIKEYFDSAVREGFEKDIKRDVKGIIDELKALFQVSSVGGRTATSGQGEEADMEVLVSFIQEAQDHLENIEEKILKLETNHESAFINDIFRSMHTIKGVSSFLGLDKIKNVSHSLESVLDALRESRFNVNSVLIDVLLEGTDILMRMIHELNKKVQLKKSGKHVDMDSAEAIEDIINALDRIMKKTEEEAALDNNSRDRIIPQFIEESKRLIGYACAALGDMKGKGIDLKALAKVFSFVHTIKGNAGFLGLTIVERLSGDLEIILENFRKRFIPGEDQDGEIDDGITTERHVQGIEALLRGMKILEEAVEESTAADTEQDGSETAYKPLGEMLVDLGLLSEDEIEHALDLQQRRIGEILVDEGFVPRDVVETAILEQVKRKESKEPGDSPQAVRRKDIRVDTEKLDKLFDLMGELITAEGLVIENPDLENYPLDRFHISAGYLSKITREMQEITMSIRMIPLDGLFNKMRRLVRDLARKFKKQVRLLIDGAETEMDRNVMEEISDPLVHIIRNSINHGIEKMENRIARGKAEEGEIRLSAKYEGNEIWITIKDDGAGLSRKKILEKAAAVGLISGDADKIPDREVWNLIFEPGFSTAQEVTEVSGRGVGMDVVRRNIEKLRGKIDILSVDGKGTEITLRIPLTLAIIDGISLKVGNNLYTLPVGDVISFQKMRKEAVTRTDAKQEVLRLREDIMPFIKVFEFYDNQTEKTSVEDGIVIIATADGKKIGLLVDEIVGYKQVVIKPLPDFLSGMRAISGCSILGNGEVSLIIDTHSLMNEVLA